MPDDKRGKHPLEEEAEIIQTEIERTDRELQRQEHEEEEKKARKLNIEEDLRTKSMILQRPLIEDARRTGAASPSRLFSVTGSVAPRGFEFPPYGRTLSGMMKEAVFRHWDSSLRMKPGLEATSHSNLAKRMWVTSNLEDVAEERMLQDLQRIEATAPARMSSIFSLNVRKSTGQITVAEEEELRHLEDTEASRYWLREKLLRRVPLEKQHTYDWLKPLGGAYGVLPYTMITTWDTMSASRRRAALWYADNYLLRWQNAIVGTFLPKTPSLKWFQEAKIKGIETQFEDWNEEIYSDKAWSEQVKKGQAELENIEEELRGYDQFTVAEERRITQIFTEYIRRETALAQEVAFYS